MQNVRNFTRAGLFISKFYPKVHELRQLKKIATKHRNLSANTMFATFTSMHHVNKTIKKNYIQKTHNLKLQQESPIGA